MPSIRQQILEACLARLQQIQIANGTFETNAGSNVSLGETVQLGEGDPDTAIALVVDDDEAISASGNKMFLRLPVHIQALAKISQAGVSEAYIAAEQIAADIKRSFELEDRLLGGLLHHHLQRSRVRTLARQPGSITVGVDVLYVLPYAEQWGNP